MKGRQMARLFETDHKPKWVLLIAGEDPQLQQEQADALKAHAQELHDREILVLALSPTETITLHGECRCLANANDFAKAYKLSMTRFSSSLVDAHDRVTWKAPIPICFADLVRVIDDMPRHQAENATRGPALSA
jgi:hypothetical protein